MQVGQEMLTPEIRRELIGLQGFEFSFRGNQEFEPWRVKAMEEMVHRQIQAILRGGGCRRRMCLCRRQRMHLPNRQRAGKRLPLTMGRNFWRQNSLWLSAQGDGRFLLVMKSIAEAGCSKNGSGVPAGQICAGNLHFAEVYQEICQIVDGIG